MGNKFLLLLAIQLAFICSIRAQEAWTQKTNFGGSGREWAVGFSIGTKGYIGTGAGFYAKKDFWEYDFTTNTWKQIADFGGMGRLNAVGFSIGTKGYVGTGSNDTVFEKKDFWEYDPAANTWTQKSDFGGTGRWGAVGFSIGTKGYIGTGFDNSYNPLKDFWEFDPALNAWTQKADFAGVARLQAVGFSIGSKGYIGTGSDNNTHYLKDFWEYDTAVNEWTQKADFGGTARSGSVGFALGGKGYISTGFDGDSAKKDLWEYDTLNNVWHQKANLGGDRRSSAVGFSMNNRGYIGVGSNGYAMKDFWEYSPCNGDSIVYADADGDGYGDSTNSLFSTDCLAPGGYVYDHSDCNDENSAIHPNAKDVCNNIDDNCNGQIDENTVVVPIGLNTSNITFSSAQLNWKTDSGATVYQVAFKQDSPGLAWVIDTVIAPTTSLLIGGLIPNTKYKWKVKSICSSAVSSEYSYVVKFITQILIGEELIHQSPLEVYPNPFSSFAAIEFSLSYSLQVSIKLFSADGKEMMTIADENFSGGNHQLNFDREKLTAGIYFLQFKTSSETFTQKLVVE